MKSSTVILIIVLAVLAAVVGGVRYYVLPTYYPHLLKQTSSDQTADQAAAQASPTPEPLAESSIATVSAQLLQGLTPRQKVAQLLAVPVTVPTNSDDIASAAAEVSGEVPGFATLFGQRISALQADQMSSAIKRLPTAPDMLASQPNLSELERKLLEPLVAVDHEGGTVQRLSGEGMTAFPSAQEQCSMDRESFKSVLDRAAKELHGVGIDIVFGPVLDLGANHPILRTRLCSDNPDVVRNYGLFWIEAMQAQNVIPVLKHYPGIGQSTVDLHTKADTIAFNPVEHSLFLGLLNTYPHVGVMTTHVSLLSEDGSAAKLCTTSPECLSHLNLSTPHLIFTDGLEMASAQGQSASGSATTTKQTLSELSALAIEAGHNVIVLGKTVPVAETDKIITDLADRYQRNPVFKQQVDRALQVIWQAKYDHWNAMGALSVSSQQPL